MIISRVQRIRHSFHHRLSEWMLGSILMGMGFLFSLPQVSMGSEILMDMKHTMSEEAWATTCILLGTVRMIVLVINGAWAKQSHARAVLGVLHLLVWTQISIVFINFAVPSPGDIIFPVFLIAEIFIVLRAAAEAGSIDASKKNGGN